MQNHIFRAIPDLDDLPEPADREDRLKTIIANLEQHQQDTRASMLREAHERLEIAGRAEDSSRSMGIDGQEATDYRQFNANMSAPYAEGSGDPCLLHGTIPTADTTIKQASVSPEVSITKEVTEQMEAYDRHAKQARDFYVKTLERQRGLRRSPEPVLGSRPQTDGFRDPRRRPTG